MAAVRNGEAPAPRTSKRRRGAHSVQYVPVQRIRPEEGLGRKRDREGHRELQRSIEQFGVLTPITVRPAPDDSGDFLLVKGQGRTLACRMLGIESIPAIVVDVAYAETEKVQQFLVENVARLKMRPVDRALLIRRARQAGEETSEIASRFGITAATIRRLMAQLDGATHSEVEALRAGGVSLAMHAAVARHASLSERADLIEVVSGARVRTREVEALFIALGWQQLVAIGDERDHERLRLFHWACQTLADLPPGSVKERFSLLAQLFPTSLSDSAPARAVVGK
ncbi:MAG: ParB/RepB/Spo0J family partition protein [bacterium]|nr:ParB/RepB/Spo0J family partition protein [bacterium]